MSQRTLTVSLVLVLLCVTAVAVAQRGRYRGFYGPDGRVERRGVPDWKVDPGFKNDVFTFVRIKYESYGRWGWPTDYPDADLNFSFRLQQLTSLHVDPDGVVLELTDPRLFDYPFIYIIEPGHISLSEPERLALTPSWCVARRSVKQVKARGALGQVHALDRQLHDAIERPVAAAVSRA